ncbi:MAG: SUMF1/EgtB/PvdO family nonheme iron enzyme, partial [Planctomycetes bacterium]|nr:SUMF1/EgtB/PvdO family nonheme iron enzyme [Planctomycetota bacterium]
MTSQLQAAMSITKSDTELSIALGQENNLVLLNIPVGTFTMGSPASEKMSKTWERPLHQVELVHNFFIGRCEITNAQFRAFRPQHHSRTAGGDLDDDLQPVTNVSWNDAILFCQWLSKESGLQVRLPTEAEWEYACRAGTTTRFFTTDEVDGVQHCSKLHRACWYGQNSKNVSHAIGTRMANAFGLHDMHGNAMEWCMDWFGADYYANSTSKNPLGPETGVARILRGGSYHFHLHHTCRSGYRYSRPPAYKDYTIGFRIVVDAPDAPDVAAHPQAQIVPQNKIITLIKRPDLNEHEQKIKDDFGGPVMSVAKAQQKIRVDGVLDDKDWQTITAQPMFLLNGRSTQPTQITTVRVCANTTHLYIAFDCQESEMSRLRIAGKKRDGRIWAGDSVEIFLDPFHKEKLKEYFQICINPDGLTSDSANGDSSWNPNIQTVGKKSENGWTMELALPLSDLGITAESIPQMWGMNFTRFRPELHAGRPEFCSLKPHEWPVERPDLMRMSEDSAWSPTNSDSNHHPDRFGHGLFAIGTTDLPTEKPQFELITKEDFSDG